MKNLMRRWRRKNYDAQLAPRMWRYVIDAAAKVYAKEIAPDERWDRVLSPATRDIVAAEMTQDFEQLAAAGAFDKLVKRVDIAPSKMLEPRTAPPLAALFQTKAKPGYRFTARAAPVPPPAAAPRLTPAPLQMSQAPTSAPEPVYPAKMPEPEFVVRRRAARAVATSPMQQLIVGPVATPESSEPEQQAEIVQFEPSTPVEVFYRRRP